MTEMEVLEPIIEIPVLLLDDLGGLRITDWMHDTLFYILNQRYVHQRPTIITTNFEDKEPGSGSKTSHREQKDLKEFDENRFGTAGSQRLPAISQDHGTGGPEDSEYLVERIGPRLRSRLQEMCVVVKMKGEDHRAQRQYFNQSGALDGGR